MILPNTLSARLISLRGMMRIISRVEGCDDAVQQSCVTPCLGQNRPRSILVQAVGTNGSRQLHLGRIRGELTRGDAEFLLGLL